MQARLELTNYFAGSSKVQILTTSKTTTSFWTNLRVQHLWDSVVSPGLVLQGNPVFSLAGLNFLAKLLEVRSQSFISSKARKSVLSQESSGSVTSFYKLFLARKRLQLNNSLKWINIRRRNEEQIHLSFYPDAKIGILGPNGSGKSTLLRIMAGTDTEWNGEAWLAEGATVGYLQQEPELDPALDVMGNVMEGVAHKKAILDEYNALMADYNDENAEKAGKIQDVIDAQNLWDLESQVEQAMDALRCPPGDAEIGRASCRERVLRLV